MDIKLNIQTVATQKGITTAYQLQKALNAYPSEAAKLWKGEVKQLSLAMMTRLCDALACNPCDLLIRTEEGAAEDGQASPPAQTPATRTATQKRAIAAEQQRRWKGEPLPKVSSKKLPAVKAKATKKGGKK